MGNKVTIPPVGNPENSSFVTALNEALDTISDEFDKVVYRDGTQSMQGHLDAGSRRIYNLPAPITDNEPLRREDIPWALRGEQGPVGPAGDITKVATRAELAAIALPAVDTTRFLIEDEQEGTFVFSADNLSAEVAADPTQQDYVPLAADPTGGTGAWVRKKTTADRVNHRDSLSPAYLRTMSDIVNGMPIDFFRFCNPAHISDIRDRTSTVDLDSVFQSIIDSGEREVNLQPGLYNTNGTVEITRSFNLQGSDPNCTEIRINSTTLPAITLANGVEGYGLRRLKVTRNGVPGVNAHGVEFLGTTDKSILEWLILEDHYDNLRIGGCDTGYIHHLESLRAYRYGIHQTNAINYGPSQWKVEDVLMARIGVDGWRIESTDGPAGMILGTMNHVRGFGITGRGIHAIGSAITPIFDIRLGGDSFIGDCGAGAVRLDTYGGKHKITGFFERTGRGATGRTLATPASNVGANIEISANNLDVSITDSTIDEASYDGIEHNGGILIVSSNMIYNNGQAAVGGRRNGVLSQGGELIMNGNKSGNVSNVFGGPIGSSQLYGLATSHGSVTINGNNLQGNVTSGSTLTLSNETVQVGNSPMATTTYMPSTIEELTFKRAASVGATGGFGDDGTINVAGGLLKNDVPYDNP